MSKERYKAAIIGVGRAVNSQGQKGGGHQIGYTHAGMYGRHPCVDLICGADINEANLRAFEDQFHCSKGFADHREMLTQVEPDIVSIATYVGLHRQLIEDAARSGVKGIICEKPFVASPADLAAVQSIVADTGVKIVIAHVRRYRATFVRARDLYAGGHVGEPLMCMAGIPGWDLSEWGSHWLDMFRFLHGDRAVRWVLGQGRVRSMRGYGHAMEEHAAAYFEFDGGGKGLVDGGVAMNGPWSMSLLGTEGTIYIRGEHELTIVTSAGCHVESFTDTWDSLWDAALSGLVDWIEGGPIPPIGLPHTFGSAELNLAAYVSMVRGDRVDLPMRDTDLVIDEWPLETLASRYAAPDIPPHPTHAIAYSGLSAAQ